MKCNSNELTLYRYVYAIRLIDHGMSNEALHYLEEIAGGVVKRPNEVLLVIHVCMFYSKINIMVWCIILLCYNLF